MKWLVGAQSSENDVESALANKILGQNEVVVYPDGDALDAFVYRKRDVAFRLRIVRRVFVDASEHGKVGQNACLLNDVILSALICIHLKQKILKLFFKKKKFKYMNI